MTVALLVVSSFILIAHAPKLELQRSAPFHAGRSRQGCAGEHRKEATTVISLDGGKRSLGEKKHISLRRQLTCAIRRGGKPRVQKPEEGMSICDRERFDA